MIAQCPSGEDEEGCTIPESLRHIMSLFFFIINLSETSVILITTESLISSNTDGVAVILTIITMLSTPILTSIFGDGSLEVARQSYKKNRKLHLI